MMILIILNGNGSFANDDITRLKEFLLVNQIAILICVAVVVMIFLSLGHRYPFLIFTCCVTHFARTHRTH